MKKVLRMCKSIWIAHFSAVVVIMTFYMMVSTLIKNDTVCMFIATFVYVTLIYATGRGCGRKDSRKIGDSFPDIKKAVAAVLIASLVPVILLVIRVIAYHTYPTVWRPYGENYEMIQTSSAFLLTIDAIYKVYNCYFMPSFSGGELIAYILPIFIPIIVFPIGYTLGLRKFSIFEKYIPSLVYKDKNGEKE